MAKGLGFSAVRGLAGTLAVLVACGKGAHDTPRRAGTSGAGGTTGTAGQGTGGKAAGGSVGTGESGAGEIGGAAGTGGVPGGGSAGEPSSGGAPTITLHTCPTEPDPACPAKVHAGNVVAFSPGDLTAYAGVTSIEGDLAIYTPDGLENLSCLESVTGTVSISLAIVYEDVSLWPLRNLKTVGEGIDLRHSFGRLYPDCAFSQLQTLGAGKAVDVYEGAAGELDLSSVTRISHVRVHESLLTKVTLPSDVTLEFGQLWFENNAELSDIAGFQNVTIELGLNPVQDTYSAKITGNPKLADCRARALGQLLLDAGNDPEWILIEGNLVCAD